MIRRDFKEKTGKEIMPRSVGSERGIRDRPERETAGNLAAGQGMQAAGSRAAGLSCPASKSGKLRETWLPGKGCRLQAAGLQA